MKLLEVASYTEELPPYLTVVATMRPWNAADTISALLSDVLAGLPDTFERHGDLAIHESAQLHASAVVSGPVVVEAGAVVGPHVRIREGVFIGRGVNIGPSVEVKSSWVFEDVALAHLNYVGNSVVGHHTNIEAGAVVANHHNERANKDILVVVDGSLVRTGCTKFGAAIGPRVRIGANAVTSPGTILPAEAVVGRLELVDQIADHVER